MARRYGVDSIDASFISFDIMKAVLPRSRAMEASRTRV